MVQKIVIVYCLMITLMGRGRLSHV